MNSQWKEVALDGEFDGFDPEKVWVVVVMDVMSGEHKVFRRPDLGGEQTEELQRIIDNADRVWGHNIVAYDAPNLRRLCKLRIPLSKIIDTLILSRLGNYFLEGHSLEAWGVRLGERKSSFSDFSELTDAMVEYCIQDCRVQCKLSKKFMRMLTLPEWAEAVPIEHYTQQVCRDMHDNGFYFDVGAARETLSSVLNRMQELENRFQVAFPPRLEVHKIIQYRVKQDGTLYANVARAIEEAPKSEVIGNQLHVYGYTEFKPGSAKHRIDRLWEAGWEPFDKTKGHKDFDRLRNQDTVKREHYDRYGWQCNEANLATLPEEAPQSAHDLAEWLCLEGRRSSLEEWIGHVGPDHRIHGEFVGIGAWTGRLAHKKPNQANVSSEFHGEVKTAVDRVKDDYDGLLRSFWQAEPGTVLVGTDAEGIQLRILAHLMKSQAYVDAIIHGVKEDETDIHNVNRRALSLDHITRNQAKTFIYAFLLGAGVGLTSHILKCSTSEASKAIENFTQSIDGLAELKNNVIPQCAAKGYFIGLDGRKVRIPGEHYVLAGMLQNGESTIMKHAARIWIEEARERMIPFKLCTWPHDEWQTEVGLPSYPMSLNMEMAEELGSIQRQSIVTAGERLGMFCPLAGSTDIGYNWKETH